MTESDCEMSSYEELLNLLDGLPMLVRETRRRRGMSMRAVHAVTGVAASTIQRCEAGTQDVSLDNAKTLLRWVGTPDVTA